MKRVGVPIGVNSLISLTKLTNLVWALLQVLKGLFDALGLEDLPYASTIAGSTLLKTMMRILILTAGSTLLSTVDLVTG